MKVLETVHPLFLVLKPAEKRLDAAEALDFKMVFFDKVANGHRDIAVDLAEVEFIDSSGLGCLVSCMKQLGANGSMRLCNAQTTVQRIFRLSRVDKVFRIYPTLDDLTESFQR